MKTRRPHAPAGELNLVPYLDVTMNLVMFLLASMTTATLAVLPVTLPNETGQDPPRRPEPFVTRVVLGADGIRIASTGSPDRAISCGIVSERCPAEAYDFAALGARLAELKAAHPEATDLVLAAEPRVPYDAIVHAIDAARGPRERPLFPDVALAAP